MVRLYKNTSGQSFFFELLTSAGAPVTSGTVTGYVTKDAGAQGALGGSVTHVGNGQYRVDLTQADTNAAERRSSGTSRIWASSSA